MHGQNTALLILKNQLCVLELSKQLRAQRKKQRFMTNDNIDRERMARIEAEFSHLKTMYVKQAEKIDSLRSELKMAKSEMSETKNTINKAQHWGRAVLWTTVALIGVASQFNSLVTWIKRL